MEKTLKDRIAIVTGASSGIGEATALALASRGASVVIAARNEEKLRALEVEILASGGHALGIQTDVSDRASVDALIDQTVSEFGMLDILVNNAGVGLSGRVAELRTEDLRDVFEVNVVGALNCIQAALPHLGPEGRIINVSSVVGKRAIPKVGGYCASKFALNALSEALRLEVESGDNRNQRISRHDRNGFPGQLPTYQRRTTWLASCRSQPRKSGGEDSMGRRERWPRRVREILRPALRSGNDAVSGLDGQSAQNPVGKELIGGFRRQCAKSLSGNHDNMRV